MARIQILGAETVLAVGIANSTTVDKATVVRVLNASGGDVVLHVQDSSFSGIGSITLPDGTSEQIQKNASDLIYGIGGALKVAKVGFTN